MPIYAYKCAACGFAKDVLRKMSDPALTQCPSCQADAFEKQVTAAGFQLKGSGWYVTDFRDSAKKDSGSSAGSAAVSSDTSSAPAVSASTDRTSSTGASSPSATPSAAAGSAT